MRIIRHRLENRIRGATVIVLSILLVGLIPLRPVFAASIEVSIPYSQTWTNDSAAVAEDSFEYRLTAEDGAPLPDEAADGYYSFTAKGNQSGSITLHFPFTKPGYYNYLVRAYIPDDEGDYHYDDQTYTLMIMAVNGDSGLTVRAVTIQDPDLAKYDSLAFAMAYNAGDQPDPGGDGGNAPGGGGGAAAAAGGPGGGAGTVIPDGETPAADIDDAETPKSIIPGIEHWALLNLILMALTVLVALADAVLYFKNPQDKYGEDYDTEDTDIKRHGLARVFATILGIMSVLMFILTEDITQPMAWVDEYTVWMLILFVATAIMVMMSKKEVDTDQYEDNYPEMNG